jgi:hypothetical protein
MNMIIAWNGMDLIVLCFFLLVLILYVGTVLFAAIYQSIAKYIKKFKIRGDV